MTFDSPLKNMRLKIDIGALKEISKNNYALIGSGGFAKRIIDKLNAEKLPLPSFIVSDEKKEHCFGLDCYGFGNAPSIKHLIFGTNVFQMQMAEKINEHNAFEQEINLWDCSADLNDSLALIRLPIQDRYFALFSLDPKQHMRWLGKFGEYLSQKGIQLKCFHPLMNLDSDIIRNAEEVILWNGSTESFSLVKQKLTALSKRFTYAESGFFPQSQHFYFDKKGVNNESQLCMDDLAWIDESHLQKSQLVKSRLFVNRCTETASEDYIFVPLQIESDSNIQRHSRFSNGMQEFIDFIESYYKTEKIVFKAHPLDTKASSYRLRKGIWSSASSLDLIMHAKCVHGINSSVLSEAALYGVPVIAEGDCLLKAHDNQQEKLIAAIIARQFNTNETHFDAKKLSRFTNFKHQEFI